MEKEKESRWRYPACLLVFILVFINCRLWSHKIPYNGAPDEYDHFELIQYTAKNGHLPWYGRDGFSVHLLDNTIKQKVKTTIDPDSGRFVFSDMNPAHLFEVHWTYLFVPPTAYLGAAWLMRLTGNLSFQTARAFNATCIAFASLFISLAGLMIWKRRWWLAIIAGIGAGFWPQVTFLGAYVNDDAFAVMCASLLVFACVRAEVAGLDKKGVVLLGAAVGLIGQSKFYNYAAFPLLLLWGIVMVRRKGIGFAKGALVSLFIGMVLASWVFVRNAMMFDGDPTGRMFLNRETERIVRDIPPDKIPCTFRRGHLTSLRHQGKPLGSLFFEYSWLHHTLESFYGRFAWMAVKLHPMMYKTAVAVFVPAMIYSSFTLLPRRRKNKNDPVQSPSPAALAFFSVPFLFLLALESLLNSWSVDFQPQGRYLLSSIPPLWLLMLNPFSKTTGRLGIVVPLILFGTILTHNILAYRYYVY